MTHASPPTPDDHPTADSGLERTLGVMARHWRMLAGLPVCVAALAVAGSYLITPRFTGQVQMLQPQQQPGLAGMLLSSLSSLGSLGSMSSALKNPGDQWVGYLKTRTIADRMVERFDLVKRYGVDTLGDARDELASRSRFEVGKDGMIDILVEDTDPKVAADLANAYVEELQRLVDKFAVSEASRQRKFFADRVQESRTGLEQAERALQQAGVQSSAIKSSPEAAVGQVAELMARVAAAEVRLKVLRGQFSDNTPEVQTARAEWAGLREQMAAVERVGTTASSKSAQDYVQRYRDYKYQEVLFELMARQYEMARADEARQGSLIQVADAAQPPERKSSPKRAVIGIVTYLLTFAMCLFVAMTRRTAVDLSRRREG